MLKFLVGKFRRMLYIIFYLTFIIRFCLKFMKRRKSGLLFIDIDNSIANTWPILGSANINILEIAPLENSIEFLKSNFDSNFYEMVFLSHREIYDFNETVSWLKLFFNKTINAGDLYFVPYPSWKLLYFKFAVKRMYQVVIFDDLSFNHENGIVKYYDSVLAKIDILDVKHYNFQFIQKLNS